MRVFKTRAFNGWARDEGLTNATLCIAVSEMNQGLIDAKLGGHVCKKRVPIEGQGKSGGLRTLIAFKQDDKAFFMYGFSKNARTNIKKDELKALKRLAKELFSYANPGLKKAITAKKLIEVKCSEKINT